MVLNLKVLKTFILDTFAGEHAIKPMDFQLLGGRGAEGGEGGERVGIVRSK